MEIDVLVEIRQSESFPVGVADALPTEKTRSVLVLHTRDQTVRCIHSHVYCALLSELWSCHPELGPAWKRREQALARHK